MARNGVENKFNIVLELTKSHGRNQFTESQFALYFEKKEDTSYNKKNQK